MTAKEISNAFRACQQFITKELEEWDGGASFIEDAWERSEGGGGYTRTIKNGSIIEKGGVAFSSVHGKVSTAMRKQHQLVGDSFYATGVSIVLHPKHPLHPIIHMNVRYFEIDDHTYWFGGGIDLTPHYINDSLASEFHKDLKKINDKYHPDFYQKFKDWADDYFYLPHRNETRGVGGVFFDHQNESSGISKQQLFSFCEELALSFPDIYKKQVNLQELQEPTEKEKKWQLHRRSRYVEFNLLHDRGTKFGIYSNGRTESILMSMPPMASWDYDFKPNDDSNAIRTQKKLLKGINWIDENIQ